MARMGATHSGKPTCDSYGHCQRICPADEQVPIQTSLVDWTLTTKDQIRWLNDHNTSVQEALMPLLDGDEDAEARDWLKKVCKPKKIWPWTGA
jgi:hypothetical protein